MTKYYLNVSLILLLLIAGPALSKAASTWNAQWITAAGNQNATNIWLSFRKEVNLKNKPVEAPTRIAVEFQTKDGIGLQ